MSQTGVITFAILAAFLVFITSRGELQRYVNLVV